MSVDTVDDLHAAEDLIGLLTEALSPVLALAVSLASVSESASKRFADQLAAGNAALSAGVTYCRPSCGWRYNGVCTSGGGDEPYDEAECGCPCRHGEVTQ